MGLGAVAVNTIEEGETFIEVPVDLIISTKQVKEIWTTRGFTDWPDDFSIAPLIIWLMEETCTAHSDFKTYIDLLPFDFTEYPLNWNDEDLEKCQGTGLKETIQNLRMKLMKQFELLRRLSEEYPQILHEWKFAKFVWAYQVINSRWWEFMDEYGSDGFIVPCADILNHQPGGGIGFFTQNQKFGFRAPTTWRKGEPIYNDYGVQSNLELLLTFGFTMESNACDSVPIELSLDPLNPFTLTIEPLLLSKYPSYKVSSLTAHTVPEALLLFTRLSTLTLLDIEQVHAILEGQTCQSDKELIAVRAAVKIISAKLKSFPKVINNCGILSLNNKNAKILQETQIQILRQNVMLLVNLTSS
eukprot:CAMPEP_0206193744 /NCGR_PEP_ID=MMETSP0166-20121206/6759_1 /ASSEMBLY_ACC=CAM_ASM_000260 /TAXON_ID=95228 /ORGANISM="Vannella robusta, Strain DIVA3 518/3/11/1/6" /LENGTH=356 /DNA_ID=CAMNT_0053610535 /DNA_START=508 /DNA_END=1574 /DNA_ORIENTATION=-